MKNLLFSYRHIDQVTLLAADRPLRQSLDCFQLLLVLEGKGELSINEEKVMLEAGSLYFINSHRFVEIHSLAHNDLYFFQLSFDIIEQKFDEPQQAGIHHDSRLPLYHSFQDQWLPDGELYGVDHLMIRNLMQRLCALQENEYRPYDQPSTIEQHRTLYELLGLVMQHTSLSTNSRISSLAEHRQQIQNVISYMQQHYAEEITRDEMAQLAGFHPRFFTKIFKQETGENFIDYLTQIRIKKAKELILLSKLNLDAIAQRIGYSNGLYLSRKFKQHTGYAPTQYVRNLQRIVVYDWVGNVLALNMKPIGASYFYGLRGLPLLQEELADIIDVGRQSVESVIELEPELIIVPKWLESKAVNELQQIAPTLIVPYGNPFERFRQLAELLERRKEANAFIAQYNRRAAEIKQELTAVIAPHETVGLYELSESHIWVLNEFHGRGGYNLYEGLGFTPPLNVQKDVIGKGQVIRLTMDQLKDYAADHMIISYNFCEDGHAHAELMLSHPVWQQIAAYQNQRIYRIDRRLFHANDVYSLCKQLELQRELLLGHAVVN